MPVRGCMEKNRPGFKACDDCKCYTYRPGDKRSAATAKGKAKRQLRAVEASKHARGK